MFTHYKSLSLFKHSLLVRFLLSPVLLLAFYSFTGATPVSKAMLLNDTLSTYPQKPTDISPLLIGETIPSLVLSDANGREVDLLKKVSERPTILIFYRGGWCPFCNKQLSGIQQIEADLRRMGYQILAVSTDSPEKLSRTADKQQLSYTLLSDNDLSASKKFGIAYMAPKNYEKTIAESSNGKNVDKLLPVPSVFILNTKGMIQFEYINPDFTQRISSELLQTVAATLAKEKQ